MLNYSWQKINPYYFKRYFVFAVRLCCGRCTYSNGSYSAIKEKNKAYAYTGWTPVRLRHINIKNLFCVITILQGLLKTARKTNRDKDMRRVYKPDFFLAFVLAVSRAFSMLPCNSLFLCVIFSLLANSESKLYQTINYSVGFKSFKIY